MKTSISLLLVIIMFIITISYTYYNDTSMFLFILLIITVFFYLYELVEYKIEAITEPIQQVERLYANIINKLITSGENMKKIFDESKGEIVSKVKTSAEQIGSNNFEFNELLNDIDGEYLRNLVNN